MKKLAFFLVLLFPVAFAGCKTQQKATAPKAPSHIIVGDNSQTSLDWPGIYTGTLPCADCDGMVTTITISKDLTYNRSTVYKGKSITPFVETGNFSWDKGGTSIQLQGITDGPSRYLVGENKLVQLSMDGRIITGELADKYVLAKTGQQYSESDLIGKKWRLMEMNSKAVPNPGSDGKDYFIILQNEENRINGFAGCNSFFGTYEMKAGSRISFSKMGSTMMACPNMNIEQELFRILEMVDNYSFNGTTLQLNKARMAPLAKFELIAE
jgi:heat shock protein HslJ